MSRWSVETDVIDDALIAVVAAVGWDRATVAAVCRQAGVSTGAFYPRYVSLETAALAVWRQRLRAAFMGLLVRVARAPELGRRGDLVIGMNDLAADRPEHTAAIELVLASRFTPELDQIWHEFCAEISALVVDVDEEIAAARMFAVIGALGLALSAGRGWAGAAELDHVLHRHFDAAMRPGPPLELPPDRAEYMHVPPVRTDDPRVDALYLSALDEVAARGFKGARLTDICAGAGVTTGFLYARWKGKQEFFLHAIEHIWGSAFGSSAALQADLTDEYGPAVAEAVMWREMTHPDLISKMILVLEMNRLARFDEAAAAVLADQEAGFVVMAAGDRAALGEVLMEVAWGLGLVAVGSALPGVSTLPYSVVLRRLGPVPV